jgi:hypothetical protein
LIQQKKIEVSGEFEKNAFLARNQVPDGCYFGGKLKKAESIFQRGKKKNSRT